MGNFINRPSYLDTPLSSWTRDLQWTGSRVCRPRDSSAGPRSLGERRRTPHSGPCCDRASPLSSRACCSRTYTTWLGLRDETPGVGLTYLNLSILVSKVNCFWYLLTLNNTTPDLEILVLAHLKIPRTGFHCMTWLSEPRRTWGWYLCLDLLDILLIRWHWQWITSPADRTCSLHGKILDPCQARPGLLIGQNIITCFPHWALIGGLPILRK